MTPLVVTLAVRGVMCPTTRLRGRWLLPRPARRPWGSSDLSSAGIAGGVRPGRPCRAAAGGRGAHRLACDWHLPGDDRRPHDPAAARRRRRDVRHLRRRARGPRADGAGAQRLRVAVGVAGPRGDADVARPARHGPLAPHRAVFVRRFGGSSLGVSYSLVMSDVTLASRHPVGHRAVGQHHPADRAEHRRALRVHAGTERPPARHVPDDRALPVQRGRLRHVLHRPGQQRAGGEPGGATRQCGGHLGGLVRGGHRAGPARAPSFRGSCSGLPPRSDEDASGRRLRAPSRSSRWARFAATSGSSSACSLGLPAVDDVELAPPRRDAGGLRRHRHADADPHPHWDAALGERAAWDVFVWYGGLITMGEVLNSDGQSRRSRPGSARCCRARRGSPS